MMLGLFLAAQSLGQLRSDVAEDSTVAFRTPWTVRMRRVAFEPAAQLDELRRAMLIRGHRRAKGEEAEVLQQIVQFVKVGIARRPQSITPGESVGGESAQP